MRKYLNSHTHVAFPRLQVREAFPPRCRRPRRPTRGRLSSSRLPSPRSGISGMSRPGVVPRGDPTPARWSRSTNHNRARDRVTRKGLNAYARFGAVRGEQTWSKRCEREGTRRRAASGPAARSPRSAASAKRWRVREMGKR